MPKDLIRFLHLSDFHVGKDNWAQQQLFDKIIAHIKSRVSLGIIPDLVFITGDIANRGQKQEYEQFRAGFFHPLEDALGGAKWSGGIYTVPGNHDLTRPSPDLLNRDVPVRPGSRFFDPTQEGRTARDQVIPRFKQFKKLAPCSAASDWIATAKGSFRVVIPKGPYRIGIVGINTAWLSMDDRDQGKLTIGLPVLEDALGSIGDCDVKILLGHHPLSWFREEEQSRTRALLGNWNVLYFHGHMHKMDVRKEDGSGRDFLTIQAGAAFQARDDEVWRNGLTWGEIDPEAHELRLSPRQWNPEHYDWPIDGTKYPDRLRAPGTDWWVWELPGVDAVARRVKQWQPPTGWALIDKATILESKRDITSLEANQFFCGAEPNWSLALTTLIPARDVVSQLLRAVQQQASAERPTVVLLIGPGGEGKSMALRQAVSAVAQSDPNARILWRNDGTLALDVDALRDLPRTNGSWIIASDGADLIAPQLQRAVQNLSAAGRSDVRFLLATRDSDWRAAEGMRIDWRPAAQFTEIVLSGVARADARAIATAWLNFDKPGAPLTTAEVDDVANKLLSACQSQAEGHEGALLGGVLEMRYGTGLRSHVKSLLLRLEAVKVNADHTLAGALSFMAAMHTEELDFLSRQVLAEAMQVDLLILHSQVVFPLAREAAAGAVGGTLLRTRHRRVAAEVCEVLRDELGVDVNQTYVRLAQASMRARRRGPVPDFANWQYKLPQHFMRRDASLAVAIASAIYSEAPGNAWLAVNLARIHRETGRPDLAEKLFLDFPEKSRADRSFWFEWATCAGTAGNHERNAVLAGWALADHPSLRVPESDDAKRALAGLGVTFSNLFLKYADNAYLEARGAAGRLGLLLPLDPATRAFCEAHASASQEAGLPSLSPEESIAKIQEAISRACAKLDQSEPIPEEVPSPESMSFAGLMYRLSLDRR